LCVGGYKYIYIRYIFFKLIRDGIPKPPMNRVCRTAADSLFLGERRKGRKKQISSASNLSATYSPLRVSESVKDRL
jgi:hypothetical protein